MKKVLVIISLIASFTSVISKAEEVPPVNDNDGSYVEYRLGHGDGTLQLADTVDTAVQIMCQNEQQFHDQTPATVYTEFVSCSNFDNSKVKVVFNQHNGDYYSEATQYHGNIYPYSGQVFVCPSTHPIHNDKNSDGQINQGDTCSNQSDACQAGKVIGSQTLTNSGQQTACIPANDSNDTYCSYERRQQYDHSYQPYTVYVMTGTVCTGLDPDVIEDPYGLDNPSDYKEPDLGCTAISNEYQSCPADPNKECSTQNGVTTCSDGCGWNNDSFVCISTMNNDNQDGDSENQNNPNNDTDGDGNPDELGVLQDIDKNTDQLEKIGRDMIRAIKGVDGSGSGGHGGQGGDGADSGSEECNADNLWCGMVEDIADSTDIIDNLDSQMQSQMDDTEAFIQAEHESETEIKGYLDNAETDFTNAITGAFSGGGTCGSISLDLPGQAPQQTSVMCAVADPFRSIASWIFSLLIILHGWSVFTRYFLPYGEIK